MDNLFDYSKNIRYNQAYFPILVDEEKFGLSRDSLHEKLKNADIMTRKLYDHLTCNMSVHKNKYKQIIEYAEKISSQSLDLPIYGDLKFEDIDRIAEEIEKIQRET